MASFACTLPHHFSPKYISRNGSTVAKLSSSFLSLSLPKRPVRIGAAKPVKRTSNARPTVRGTKVTCWFRFGNKDAEGAGIYGSQSRDDFDRDDVEQYFNYMGMLAVEGTYDKMEALLNQDIHPVDILLMLAASEGDKPKIEELLRAGAKYDVKDVDGRTALDRASNEIKDFIVGFTVRK